MYLGIIKDNARRKVNYSRVTLDLSYVSFFDNVLKEAKCLQFPLGFTPHRMSSYPLCRSSLFTRSSLASLSDNSRFLELCLSSQGRVRFML